ncbi:MAG: ribosome small subunit-dependent GTPase A [Maribacter sp.]|uniref:ribosome small subunit-dependent GTPase A n=1 Tax=Maribacter sp. TaxID=1897614 RepID=UPI0032973698
MTLEDLGYNKALDDYRKEQNFDSFAIGRVILEHKDRYVVKTGTAELESELIGNMRFTAESRYDLPAVGDWVAISEYDENKSLIHGIFPRHSILERQAVGTSAQVQIIATNIDYGLIVQSVNRDYNINRLERYLTICNTANVAPIVVLSKIDLVDEKKLNALLTEVKKRIKTVPVYGLSNHTRIGLEEIKALIKHGKTYCLLGSSGVGKSTLLNQLTAKTLMPTAAISEKIDRGKHITTHRELVVLESGGILIDNPGMREIGITTSSAGLETTFDVVIELAQNCKFSDCTHTNEKGCAILTAVASGEIDSDSYANFQKMEKERDFFESSVAEKKKKDKDLGKLIKNMKKERNRNRY